MTTYTRDETLLRIEGVSKFFGEKQAIASVDVTIRNLHCSDRGRCLGQVVAFLGPSGCGKTVLLRIIAGLEQPTTGRVVLDNSDQPITPGMVGFIFQGYPMSRNRTVRGNLELAGRVGGLDATSAKERALHHLAYFGLEREADRYPAELSGGMRQRVAIARQLMNLDGPCALKTRMLLMDEPFSALDPANTSKVCHLIRNVADAADNNTVILVTHDLRAALSVADMVWVMGRSHRPDGSRGGGEIVRAEDLAAIGLAWAPDVHHMPEFMELEQDLSEMFERL